MTPAAGSAAAERVRAVAIVPARIASQRLPRKMLLDRTGAPLFVHTARNVAASGAFARVVVATDAREIVDAAARAGIECVMTRADHASGTDRVHEAWSELARAGENARVVVNVQGDEPELAPADLARLVALFADTSIEIATLCGPLRSAAEADQASVVKVVRDARGDALYFSRARIPSRGHARRSDEGGHARASDAGGHARGAERDADDDWTILRRHIGVYAFTPVALDVFCALTAGRLESLENLEQLRWLEAGRRMRVLDAERVPEGIDTELDYERFVARCAARSHLDLAARESVRGTNT